MYLELIQKSKKCKQNQKIKKLFIHKKANTDDSELSKNGYVYNKQNLNRQTFQTTQNTEKNYKNEIKSKKKKEQQS